MQSPSAHDNGRTALQAMDLQLEIKDLVRLDIQFIGNGLHQQRMVLAGE